MNIPRKPHRHYSARLEAVMETARDVTCDECGVRMLEVVADVVYDWVSDRETAAVEESLGGRPRARTRNVRKALEGP